MIRETERSVRKNLVIENSVLYLSSNNEIRYENSRVKNGITPYRISILTFVEESLLISSFSIRFDLSSF